MRFASILFLLTAALVIRIEAAILTVNTTNNVSPGAGETSLLQALGQVKAGDEIRFNIPGTGPHYIVTPPDGYPLITNNNVTINGYSQPGAVPNSNPILAANSAKLQIVLDSRAGGHKVMSFPLTAANDDSGYSLNESAVLGVVDAQGFRAQGLSFLGVPAVGADDSVGLYFISFARGGSGVVSGCWLGVDPDGKTVAGSKNGITGYRYRVKDPATGEFTKTVLVNNVIVGVEPKATNAVQQFNVFAGMSSIPIAIEGENTRISGNFITVLPDGLHDVNVALDPLLNRAEYGGAIEIGRSGNNTLIGTDGDNVNDANERNVFGGQLPPELDGYSHLIEFYGQSPGTNVVIAGNYIGIGVDGKTRFTNGVPVLNATGESAQYRIGSDLNGMSDALEGNLIANNYPADLFPPSDFQETPESLGFLSQPHPGATVSLRGNSLINNFPFPASPLRNGGVFLGDYYAKALRDPSGNVSPVLDPASTRARIRGSVPAVDISSYSGVVVDVYLADPEGIATGTAAAIPELPGGFVQGLKYLGSFPVNAPQDLTTNRVSFGVDISSLNVPASSQITITANYIPATGSTGETPVFSSFTRTADGKVSLAWDSGSLQSATSLEGPWTEVPTTGNTLVADATEKWMFFRLQSGGASASSAGAPLTSPFSNVIQVP